jgi:hypothetical protein
MQNASRGALTEIDLIPGASGINIFLRKTLSWLSLSKKRSTEKCLGGFMGDFFGGYPAKSVIFEIGGRL